MNLLDISMNLLVMYGPLNSMVIGKWKFFIVPIDFEYVTYLAQWMGNSFPYIRR